MGTSLVTCGRSDWVLLRSCLHTIPVSAQVLLVFTEITLYSAVWQ